MNAFDDEYDSKNENKPNDINNILYKSELIIMESSVQMKKLMLLRLKIMYSGGIKSSHNFNTHGQAYSPPADPMFTPYQYFKEIFDDDIIDTIVKNKDIFSL